MAKNSRELGANGIVLNGQGTLVNDARRVVGRHQEHVLRGLEGR